MEKNNKKINRNKDRKEEEIGKKVIEGKGKIMKEGKQKERRSSLRHRNRERKKKVEKKINRKGVGK